ncbi:hypothetical protein ZEAMMB73_Zm00001d019252 [Zea mays]|uniref:Uncharacterized protein n=1 Tax=Zea mays TaxID=4577 RepID=A0A1D6HWF0_MAIZE|nr:hypothetical protein ZEAMMB73_Zm00001d019252 [Zea mays]ONM52554.1 hypothetical protein ZEAMMB73_Zm00001d019252 [Zea mays]ONM52562.1 hypothetical protein ZEAMMB73_Zm00001d019252 [Zea mays]ONM52566.1 hypothetical protein ZEAMMB73_Zm00001d019252 [Zea mays]
MSELLNLELSLTIKIPFIIFVFSFVNRKMQILHAVPLTLTLKGKNTNIIDIVHRVFISISLSSHCSIFLGIDILKDTQYILIQ